MVKNKEIEKLFFLTIQLLDILIVSLKGQYSFYKVLNLLV